MYLRFVLINKKDSSNSNPVFNDLTAFPAHNMAVSKNQTLFIRTKSPLLIPAHSVSYLWHKLGIINEL